ncbi:hypothetical protein PHJA_000839300 [Phtheirospermum japonicum]|uniref:Uncharacterized protein n=1 Tax=Phtheirospermum japonicum TaxID=374723 RepID=A0A830BTI7_9LAMI|nr:hypothetical protein PHJA_000839300 [Phtheirospermum japonicum]
MASFHSRSNSFPSQSHSAMNDVEDHLERLKASQATSTSSSSICSNLASLRDLHDEALSHEGGESWINELLEGSLRHVDLCGFSKDIACLTKESVQELESSIRRNADGINAYVASRKKINKMVNKCIKSSKSFSNQNSTALPAIGMMLKEAESLNLSILKSVLTLLSGENKENKKSWSLFSKFTQSASRVHSEAEQESFEEDLCSLNIHKSRKSIDDKNMLKQLKTSEMTIQEIEKGLEALFRSLVKTRVSLLNVLSHYPSWLLLFFDLLTTHIQAVYLCK